MSAAPQYRVAARHPAVVNIYLPTGSSTVSSGVRNPPMTSARQQQLAEERRGRETYWRAQRQAAERQRLQREREIRARQLANERQRQEWQRRGQAYQRAVAERQAAESRRQAAVRNYQQQQQMHYSKALRAVLATASRYSVLIADQPSLTTLQPIGRSFVIPQCLA